MARVSNKVYEWSPKKGKAKGLASVYDATVNCLNTLFDIYHTHKTWGEDWYELVRMKSYENAKMVLIARKQAKGKCFLIALNCIEDLAYLDAEMKLLEKGGNE